MIAMTMKWQKISLKAIQIKRLVLPFISIQLVQYNWSPSQWPESDNSLRPKSSSDDLRVETAIAWVIKLLIPISICMLLVVLMIKFVFKTRCEEGEGIGSVMTPIDEDQQTNNSDKAIASIINALVFVLVMSTNYCISTFVLVLLWIIRFYKVIMGYLIVSIGFLLLLVWMTTLEEICHEFNISKLIEL